MKFQVLFCQQMVHMKRKFYLPTDGSQKMSSLILSAYVSHEIASLILLADGSHSMLNFILPVDGSHETPSRILPADVKPYLFCKVLLGLFKQCVLKHETHYCNLLHTMLPSACTLRSHIEFTCSTKLFMIKNYSVN